MKGDLLLSSLKDREKQVFLSFPNLGTHLENGRKFFSVRELEKISWEIFVFEYYLLKLNDALSTAKDAAATTLHDAIADTRSLLSHLYRLTGKSEYELRTTKAIKESHAKRANYFLMDAAKNNDDVLLEAALDAGAWVNFCFVNDYALAYAVKNKNHLMVERLIREGANVNIIHEMIGRETPLFIAVENNDPQMVKLLISSGANVQFHFKERGNVFTWACMRDEISPEILDILLAIPNVDLNAISYKDKTLLEIALERMKRTRELKKVELLLKAGVSVSPTEFNQAITIGVNAVQLLLNAGYVCTKEDLLNAILDSDVVIIDLVNERVKEYVDIKLRLIDEKDYTDLIFYTTIAHVEKVKEILRTPDIEINAFNQLGNTALITACQLGREEIVKLLLEAKADVNLASPKTGLTALMEASKRGYHHIIQLMIDHEANVNQQTDVEPKGKTALMFAIEREEPEVVTTLLKAKDIDINLKSEANKSANDMGLNSNSMEIREAFKIKNAQPEIMIIKEKVQSRIDHFKNKGKGLFGIGNLKKAKKIEDALKRSETYKEALLSTQAFLKYSQHPKEESIMDALNYHRIGFFGKPGSGKMLEALIEEQSHQLKK